MLAVYCRRVGAFAGRPCWPCWASRSRQPAVRPAAEVVAGGPVELLAQEGRPALLGREALRVRLAQVGWAAQPAAAALQGL